MASSAAKRASAINVGLGWLLLTLPIPDGAISQGDRQHLLGMYSGIAAAAPTVTTAETSRAVTLTVGQDPGVTVNVGQDPGVTVNVGQDPGVSLGV